MSISDPEKLVAEFKKSGEFDRLRRELLQQFRDHDAIGTFMSRVQDIVQQRLAEDERLQYLSPEAVHNELMQDMDRFPLVQRSVADLPALMDPAFSASIRRSLATLLNGGDGSGKQSGGKGAENGDDVRMNDSEGSDSDSSDNDDDDENEHERESEDELMMPGGESPENERGRPDAPDVDNKSGKPKMVNGVSETTTNNDTSHSSSPTNCARAQLDS